MDTGATDTVGYKKIERQVIVEEFITLDDDISPR